MGRWLGQVLGALLRSLLVSLILFVIVWWAITKEFPPKLTSVKRSFAQFQTLSDLTLKIARTQRQLEVSRRAGEDPSATDVEEFRQLQTRRAQVGVEILKDLAAPAKPGESPAELNARLRKLEAKIAQLEAEIQRLSQERSDAATRDAAR